MSTALIVVVQIPNPVPLSVARRNIAQALKNCIKQEGYEPVFLFGSMAVGNIHQNSDVD
jgi:predicted nucleotidyltransferase